MTGMGTALAAALLAFYLALGLRTKSYSWRTRALVMGVTALASLVFYLLW